MLVKIIKDSISPDGIRLTTFHLRYWRAIHSELMTHKDLSRNARSSRAVPTMTLLSEEPFVPEFGKNKPGMQSSELIEHQAEAEKVWLDMVEYTRNGVKRLHELGVHKQWANRPLEWFGWIDVLVTATHWANFYALRISEYAQPEFDALARLMQHEQRRSTPVLLQPGQWHMPYILDWEADGRWGLPTLLAMSTARCARLSYTPFDGVGDVNAELARFEKLVVSRPVHASPAEHQATPDRKVSSGFTLPTDKPDADFVETGPYHWEGEHLHGNFHGWVQHRKLIPHEVVR